MNGLKAEPVWRSAWVARLNWPGVLVSRPPTMARTAPSALITTMAACTLDPSFSFSSSTLRMPSSAAFWMRLS